MSPTSVDATPWPGPSGSGAIVSDSATSRPPLSAACVSRANAFSASVNDGGPTSSRLRWMTSDRVRLGRTSCMSESTRTPARVVRVIMAAPAAIMPVSSAGVP